MIISNAYRCVLVLSGYSANVLPPLPTPESAHQMLCKMTGKDYGLDAEAWDRYLRSSEGSHLLLKNELKLKSLLYVADRDKR